MYGDAKKAMHPEDASKFSSELINIGCCLGGGVVLNMARGRVWS